MNLRHFLVVASIMTLRCILLNDLRLSAFFALPPPTDCRSRSLSEPELSYPLNNDPSSLLILFTPFGCSIKYLSHCLVIYSHCPSGHFAAAAPRINLPPWFLLMCYE
ncbi:hypothetical protein C8J55DRAFT_308967 [Lentinula edodes]|uniref:Uncharacterized protein n=1 Tax=Lentinula lateritia TaxID=40482 RepID=A0A9W8ZPN2_9AGAR|nr:hypothetical protein C8J55DRAFT_308967 [Lentinula edodes]